MRYSQTVRFNLAHDRRKTNVSIDDVLYTDVSGNVGVLTWRELSDAADFTNGINAVGGYATGTDAGSELASRLRSETDESYTWTNSSGDVIFKLFDKNENSGRFINLSSDSSGTDVEPLEAGILINCHDVVDFDSCELTRNSLELTGGGSESVGKAISIALDSSGDGPLMYLNDNGTGGCQNYFTDSYIKISTNANLFQDPNNTYTDIRSGYITIPLLDSYDHANNVEGFVRMDRIGIIVVGGSDITPDDYDADPTQATNSIALTPTLINLLDGSGNAGFRDTLLGLGARYLMTDFSSGGIPLRATAEPTPTIGDASGAHIMIENTSDSRKTYIDNTTLQISDTSGAIFIQNDGSTQEIILDKFSNTSVDREFLLIKNGYGIRMGYHDVVDGAEINDPQDLPYHKLLTTEHELGNSDYKYTNNVNNDGIGVVKLKDVDSGKSLNITPFGIYPHVYEKSSSPTTSTHSGTFSIQGLSSSQSSIGPEVKLYVNITLSNNQTVAFSMHINLGEWFIPDASGSVVSLDDLQTGTGAALGYPDKLLNVNDPNGNIAIGNLGYIRNESEDKLAWELSWDNTQSGWDSVSITEKYIQCESGAT
tara:strand:- start:12685 stop:14472 length:1788 start_codon:yes stop_codon:yes gene_type:complete